MESIKRTTGYNSKFVQKWLTVVHVNPFVNYLVQCCATIVLQAMPFLHKFANRYRQALDERTQNRNDTDS